MKERIIYYENEIPKRRAVSFTGGTRRPLRDDVSRQGATGVSHSADTSDVQGREQRKARMAATTIRTNLLNHNDMINGEITMSSITELLQTPRELCLTCYNWCTQEDVGEHDWPQCSEGSCHEAYNYLIGLSDTCPKHLEL